MNEPLCGTYNPSIDTKGRMSFPTKLRDILGAEFYLCVGHDKNYIAVYSVEEFKNYCGKLNEIPGDIGSEIRRELLAGADKQIHAGRIIRKIHEICIKFLSAIWDSGQVFSGHTQHLEL